MRIAVNGWFADRPNTGSGQYTIELARHLAPLVSAIDVVVPADSARAVSGQLGGAARLTIHPVPLPTGKHLGKLWFEQVGFPVAARRLRAEVAHVPYFGSGLWCPVPTVVTVHDVIMLILPVHREAVHVRQYTRLVGAGARRAKRVLCDSECTRRDVAAHVGVRPARLEVVPLAVGDRYRAGATPAELAEMRGHYGLDDRTVLYVGGLDWRKNLETLVRAISLTRSGAKLAIAGKPHTANSLVFPDVRPEIARLGLQDRIAWIGFVPEADKVALYAAARAFAFPSRYEGFGLTPLEAMAAGAPVVCSNAASLPEVVGDAAVLVDPDDAAGFAGAIDRLLTDAELRDDLVTRGKRRAAAFTWERTAEMTLAAYHRARETSR